MSIPPFSAPKPTKTTVGLGNVTNDAQLKIASNLSDVASASSSRTNLGLGSAATMTGPSGTIVGTSDTQTLTNKTITDSSNSVGTGTLTNPCNFSAYPSSTVSVTSAFTVKLNADTVEYDTGSNYNSSTYLFTAPVAGFYFFSARATFSSFAAIAVEIALAVNGTTPAKRGTYNEYCNAVMVSAILKLSANDTVEAILYSSTTQNTASANDKSSNYFQGYLISGS